MDLDYVQFARPVAIGGQGGEPRTTYHAGAGRITLLDGTVTVHAPGRKPTHVPAGNVDSYTVAPARIGVTEPAAPSASTSIEDPLAPPGLVAHIKQLTAPEAAKGKKR